MNKKHLSEADLWALLIGEGTEEMQSHMAVCKACREAYDALEALDALLEDRLYRLHCPEPGMLAQYVEDRLPPEQRREVASHVAHCLPCQREIEAVTPFVISKGTRVREWLEVLAEGVRRVFRAYPVPQVTPYPVRGGTPQMRRYRTRGLELLLSLVEEPEGRDIVLVGQVVPSGTGSDRQMQGRVTVRPKSREADIIHRAALDERGGFVIPSVLPGSYVFRVHLEPDKVIEFDLHV